MSTDIERHDGIDREAILRHLNLNPQEVSTQALLLICQRYELDPVMKHVVLISGRPYVTRDGYLHVAHRTGQLDGIEVIDTGDTPDEWWAKVAVWRKDMSKPFTYVGRYPKSGQQKRFGPEMAIKTAEVMALRRAFDVTGIGAADEQWDVPEQVPVADEGTHVTIRSIIAGLEDFEKEALQQWWQENKLPPISKADRLTVAQAEMVFDHLEQMDDEKPFEGEVVEA